MACKAARSSIAAAAFAHGDGEQRRQRDQRDGHQVLEQQHGEGQAAVAQRQLALLLQHLQREGRRGQRQRQPGEQRRPGQAERRTPMAASAARRGDRHLGAAEAEDRRRAWPTAAWGAAPGRSGTAAAPRRTRRSAGPSSPRRRCRRTRGRTARSARRPAGSRSTLPMRSSLAERRRHHGGGQKQRHLD